MQKQLGRARLLLADDDREVLERLRTLLEPDFDILELVQDGAAALEAAARSHPDVVVLDLFMPVMNGLDAALRFRHEVPEIGIIFLTMHADSCYVSSALEAGVSGYVLKSSAALERKTAIHEALAGRSYLTPSLTGG